MHTTTAPTATRPLRVGAVVLAAGAGARMGYRPKSLLERDGVPLIRRLVTALLEAGATEILVVLGHHAQAIQAALLGLPVSVLHNPDPDAGLITSQRLGLTHLSPTLDLVIMALADQPLIEAADVQQLIKAFEARPAGTDLLYPKVQGQPGNPVVLSSAARNAILASPQPIGCRQWREAHASKAHAWNCENAGFVLDLDTPEDISRFVRTTGHRLEWPASAGEQDSRPDASA